MSELLINFVEKKSRLVLEVLINVFINFWFTYKRNFLFHVYNSKDLPLGQNKEDRTFIKYQKG